MGGKEKQPKPKKPSKKKISLKWSLLFMIVLCWVLPIFLMVFFIGNYVADQMKAQTQETILTSLDNAVDMATARLNAATNASRNASYSEIISNAHQKYQEDGDVLSLNNSILNFLVQQYDRDEKFKSSCVSFFDVLENGIPHPFFSSDRQRPADSFYYGEKVVKPSYDLACEGRSDICFFQIGERVYMQRNMLHSKNMKQFGYINLELDLDEMFQSMTNVVMANDVKIWLDKIPTVVMGEDMDENLIGEFPHNGTDFREVNGDTYIVGGIPTSDYTLFYMIRVDNGMLEAQSQGFLLILLGLCAMLLPFLILGFLFFNSQVNRPVKALNKAALEIENGNFGIRAEGPFHSGEFQYMADSFNEMSDTLKNQFEKLFKEELALRDAKIMALQLQINPHFLNNTLEIINWEARLAGDEKVCRMLESLSVMLSATMDRKQERIVHLSEEMTYVDAYLYIISERLGNRLVVEKNIDPELEDFYVPRLVMQPIIENAVEHGIQPLQKGLITIRVYRQEDSVVLEVENDGIMTNEDEENIAELLGEMEISEEKEQYNLGIRNVNQRLKIIYGEKAGLSITMNKNQHTVARILIPNHNNNQEDTKNNKNIH